MLRSSYGAQEKPLRRHSFSNNQPRPITPHPPTKRSECAAEQLRSAKAPRRGAATERYKKLPRQLANEPTRMRRVDRLDAGPAPRCRSSTGFLPHDRPRADDNRRFFFATALRALGHEVVRREAAVETAHAGVRRPFLRGAARRAGQGSHSPPRQRQPNRGERASPTSGGNSLTSS